MADFLSEYMEKGASDNAHKSFRLVFVELLSFKGYQEEESDNDQERALIVEVKEESAGESESEIEAEEELDIL
ncbi:MAG: hypothetical protein EZS28_033527 [Streblomastix strix]|uniref:Uncharacterized protein n=1 Tax=Streblomastix strix TaxID=222440 RepID=A0A5J4UKL5_9EUKA|nr:MAG: hypothetical protein EZS28_033527 [Streblomastix strix]